MVHDGRVDVNLDLLGRLRGLPLSGLGVSPTSGQQD